MTSSGSHPTASGFFISPTAVLQHVGWVRALALKLAGHGDVADEVAQETWLRVLRNPPPSGIGLRPWMVGTMRRILMERSRKERHRREREKTVTSELARERTVDDELDRQVGVERGIVAHVLELDAPVRRTLLLRYFEELSIEAIAAQEGLTESGVRTRLHRGYVALRARLAGDHRSAAGAWFATCAPSLLEQPARASATASLFSGPSKAMTVTQTARHGAVLAALLFAVAAGLWALSRKALEHASDDWVAGAQLAQLLSSGSEASLAESVQGREAKREPAAFDDVAGTMQGAQGAAPGAPPFGAAQLLALDDHQRPVAGAPVALRRFGSPLSPSVNGKDSTGLYWEGTTDERGLAIVPAKSLASIFKRVPKIAAFVNVAGRAGNLVLFPPPRGTGGPSGVCLRSSIRKPAREVRRQAR